MSVIGEVTTKVKDQSGDLVPLSNNKINAINREQVCTDIFQIWIK